MKSVEEQVDSLGIMEKLSAPDFHHGATPHETAEFFRRIGQPERAEAAIRTADQTPDKVVYILTQPGVGGYKKRGASGVSYVSVDVVGDPFGEEVITHEGIHNRHERRWWKIDVPGWATMTEERRRIVFDSLGIDNSFDEVSGIEALTQYATQQEIWETESGYDARIVPQGIRLFETLGQKSQRATVGWFLNMALHGNTGGRQEFAHGVRIGTNIIMLEGILSGRVFQPERIARTMSHIIESQKKDFVIRDMSHAQQLVDSYLEVTGNNWEEKLVLVA